MAILATAIINFSARAPEKPVKVEDFFPEDKVETPEEQQRYWLNLFATKK